MIWHVAGAHGRNPTTPIVAEQNLDSAMRKWLYHASERDGVRESGRKVQSESEANAARDASSP